MWMAVSIPSRKMLVDWITVDSSERNVMFSVSKFSVVGSVLKLSSIIGAYCFGGGETPMLKFILI